MYQEYKVGSSVIYYDIELESYEEANIIDIGTRRTPIASDRVGSMYRYKVKNKHGVRWVDFEQFIPLTELRKIKIKKLIENIK